MTEETTEARAARKTHRAYARPQTARRDDERGAAARTRVSRPPGRRT